MAKIIKFLFWFGIFYFFLIHPLIVYWLIKMKDPYQLKLTFGKMGVGKTGLIAKLSMEDLKNKSFERVYTTIGVPGTYKFDFKDVIENNMTFPPESSIYVDEFGLIYNNRDFKTFPEQSRRWFKYIRQSRCKLTVFSQAPDIDKAIRDLCHSYSMLRRVGPFVFELEVSKNIDVGSDQDGNGQIIDNYFKLGLIGGIRIHYLPRYFELWNSFDPPTWEYCKAEMIPITPQLLRAFRFDKFYKYNFRNVYTSLCAGVSSTAKIIYHRFVNTIFISPKDFNRLQFSNVRDHSHDPGE